MASYNEVFHATELLVIAVARFVNYSEVTKKREEEKEKYDKLTPQEKCLETTRKFNNNMCR